MPTSKAHSTIKWGILGLGNIAHHFAEDLQVVPDAQIIAVASRSQEKADEFAQKFKAKRAYNNYEALAKDSEVDAVYVATPHVFHHENTMMCLAEGKAVLCEKPFAMNRSEVETMIASAKNNDALLMEALWTAFLPNFQFVRFLIQQNVYGKVIKLEADFGFQMPFDPNSRIFNKSLGGGSLLDIGIYPIFLALATLGHPDQIEAKAVLGKTEVDEVCDIRFGYESGSEAFLKSTIQEHTPTIAVFYCEEATITMHTNFYQISSVSIETKHGKETLDFAKLGRGFYCEASHFCELLRQGKKESPIMTFDFSLQGISLLDTIREKIGLHY